MRILRLTSALERKLLRARHSRDSQAERIAARIVADVRKHDDPALFSWTKKLDRTELTAKTIWVSASELVAAKSLVSREFLEAIQHAARNVRRVAERQLPKPWSLEVEPGVTISQLVRPLDSVGCYIPAGRFPLVSTMVMTVVPAQVAGVPRVVVASPNPAPQILAAASVLGVSRVARIGGAQAIAALAYGTRSVPRVEKIVGPGNRFVTAAKQLVSCDCAIDLPAGPTEAMILASRGNPQWIAADLLAQAEHAPDAVAILVTTSLALARCVQSEVASQLSALPPENPAHLSTRRSGLILVAPSLSAACGFANRFAPEHLSLADDHEPAVRSLLKRITAAGTIFLGPHAAQALGDYASGSNHVLPTAGWARARAGLSAADFVKSISVQSVSGRGVARLAHSVQTLARAEGLLAHANAVEVRR
ncbi:MAG TPA: histidinol dehydrogenase [Candidatus Acidoferrales bacterium]|nr:histidinol dehydrogenase [Candidatus Acidoferrales bacterium]